MQFKVDGNDLGAEDTAAPYTMPWNARERVSAGNAHAHRGRPRHAPATARRPRRSSVTVDPTGLVAAYGFEETTGTAVDDSSGKGNPGTIVGRRRASTAGRFGRALTFDGVNDCVNVADAATLDLTNAMTLEAWVNPPTAGGWRTVADEGADGRPRYGIYANTDTNRPSAHVVHRHRVRHARHRRSCRRTRGRTSPRPTTARRCGCTSTARRSSTQAAVRARSSPRPARCGSAATRSGASTSAAASTRCASTAACCRRPRSRPT